MACLEEVTWDTVPLRDSLKEVCNGPPGGGVEVGGREIQDLGPYPKCVVVSGFFCREWVRAQVVMWGRIRFHGLGMCVGVGFYHRFQFLEFFISISRFCW